MAAHPLWMSEGDYGFFALNSNTRIALGGSSIVIDCEPLISFAIMSVSLAKGEELVKVDLVA